VHHQVWHCVLGDIGPEDCVAVFDLQVYAVHLSMFMHMLHLFVVLLGEVTHHSTFGPLPSSWHLSPTSAKEVMEINA